MRGGRAACRRVLPSVIVSGIDQQPTTEVYDAVDVATRAIAGLGSVEEVLQVIIDQIRPLVGARYAALGIVDAVTPWARAINGKYSSYVVIATIADASNRIRRTSGW